MTNDREDENYERSKEEGDAPFASSTNDDDEYNEDEDSDYEEDGADDNEEDAGEDDDGILSYLFDKSSFKQHLVAILVALTASAISYFHLVAPNYDIATKQITIPTVPLDRDVPLKVTDVHHHESYKRTNNLAFCPVDFLLPSETNQGRIKRVLPLAAMDDKLPLSVSLDNNLQLFEFNFPKEYIDIMNDYYVADETGDDFYTKTLLADEEMTDNAQFQCLVEAALENQHRSTVPMNSVAYITPKIQSYYPSDDSSKESDVKCSVKAIMDEQKAANHNKKLKAVSLSYTGFTAKFVNLSTKSMNLFWDGKNKPRFRAKVEPFESFATVTTPGNSFYFAPTYDKEHAVERWVMTEDEAVVAYDVLTNDEELMQSLTTEEKKKYIMQKLNLKYGREYLAKTQRSWLSMFPRPMPMHHFHEAKCFGQEHVVKTDQTHFISLPTDRQGAQEVWRMLDYADYDKMLDESKKSGKRSLNLSQYREKGSLELTMKAISVTPRIFEIDNFLSDIEADHLLQMAKKYNITEAGNNANGKKKKNAATTNAWIRREMSPIVDAVYHRAADLMNIDESLLRHRNEHEHSELATHHSIAEAMHVTQYTAKKGYQPISDAAQASLKNRYQPNRFATIMFFLDDLEKDESPSGDTIFPLAVNTENHDGVRVIPKKGKALLVYNMLPDGNIDDLSQHSSEILEEGVKSMGSIFVWDPIID